MLLISLLTLATATLQAGDEPRLLFDFGPDDAVRWTTVHDTVMGGRSEGRVAFTEAGTLRFTGKISLENNGGFTSFRSRSVDLELAGSEGVEIRVKGDGRTYIFSTERRDVALFGGGYWQEFGTEAGTWTTIRLPWNRFVPTSFGREVETAPSFDPAQLSSMGVYLYDKQEGPFALELDEISAYWPGSTLASQGPSFPEDFSVVLSLATTLGLDQELVDLNGKFTLFAPTDEAFQALPEGLFQDLARPENAKLLKSILLFHVNPDRWPAAQAVKLVNAPSLEGSTLDFTIEGGQLKVEGARVIATDLEFAGGVVHAIDAVMVPPTVEAQLKGLPTAEAGPIPGVSTVFALVEAADLGDTLAQRERYTLFAPTDEAFAALPAEVVEALLLPENQGALREVLLHHVVDGGVTAYQAQQLARSVPAGDSVDVAALDGTALVLKTGRNGGLEISGGQVVRPDVLLGNAVIHVIDTVLVPEGLELAPADAVTAFLEAVVARGVRDFNSGDTAACAANYRTALEALLTLGSLEDPALIASIQSALKGAEREASSQASWALRLAIDEVRNSR